MSDETAPSPENSEKPAAAPRARRVSTPRPKKVAKAAPAEEAPAPVVAEVVSIPFPSSPAPAPEREREEQAEKSAQSDTDWPEPEAASTGGNGPQSESNKRKRRRRKGKGQNAAQQNGAGPVSEEVVLPLVAPEAKPAEGQQDQRPRQNPPSQQQQPQQHQPQRPKVDPELLTKMAWKIYLAEVSEEGVALIGDNDAKDLSRRCFRLAEIFIEEQARRR
jgi:hypothetical protein